MFRAADQHLNSTVSKILLQKNGSKVDFVDGAGKHATYEVRTIRAPTDAELTIITTRYAAFGAKL